jgi:hypothetical protein
MEKGEISTHEVKVVDFVKGAKRWVTGKEIVEGTGVKYRTVNNHCNRLIGMGIFDLAEVFPHHRYRYSEKADKRNKAYVLRLANAREALNL